MRIHVDDRRCAWVDVFADALPHGQLNVTTIWPGAILAWHRHEQQDDRMLVIRGSLKVGVWWPDHPEQVAWTVLTELHPDEYYIPRGAWHGYQNLGTDPAIVLTWINQPYNPKDELRLDPGAMEPPMPTWERRAR